MDVSSTLCTECNKLIKYECTTSLTSVSLINPFNKYRTMYSLHIPMRYSCGYLQRNSALVKTTLFHIHPCLAWRVCVTSLIHQILKIPSWLPYLGQHLDLNLLQPFFSALFSSRAYMPSVFLPEIGNITEL